MAEAEASRERVPKMLWGLAIVAVSSEMPELLLLADRILVLSEGRQTGMLSRAEASEERIMQLAAPRRRHAGRQAA